MEPLFIDNKIDILPIYDVGRSIITQKDKISELHPINKDIYKSIEEILKICHNYDFHTGFLELSLFDPRDKKAEEFFTVLASSSEENIKEYRETMGCNIEKNITILPNSVFYEAPFYFQKKETDKFFNILYKNKFSGRITGFNTEADIIDNQFKQPTQKQEKIVENINNFFVRVEEHCFKEKQGRNLNSFLIVPLFRPAAPIDNSDDHIFRGGALMLFGNTDDKFNVERFALIIQNLLLKQIFKASHSEIEVQLKQINVELSLYHHLGNKLGKILNPINQMNFIRDNLTNSQKKNISKVEKRFDLLLSNINMVLKSYQNYFKSSSNNQNYTIEKLVNEVYKTVNNFKYFENKKNIILSYDEEIKNSKIKLPNSILYLIVEQFLENSTNIFDKNSFSIDSRRIDIFIEEKTKEAVKTKPEKTVVRFRFINNGPFIDEEIISKLGHQPIKKTTSSGLGYYFLNFCLDLCGSIKQGNRFFNIRNCYEDKGIELSFEFDKN